jgi:hypothetical protein
MSAQTSLIVLDKPVTLIPGTTHKLRIQNKNDDIIKEYTISAVIEETTTATIAIEGSFSPIPAEHDKWIITTIGNATKYFRLTKTTRVNDLTRKLSCIEYNANIYDDTKALTLPAEPVTPTYEAHLRAEEVQKWNGSPDTEIHLSWTGFALSWNVFVKSYYDGTYIYKGTTTIPFFRLTDLIVMDEAYTVCVTHTTNPSDGITMALTVTGTAAITVPNAPLNLSTSLIGSTIKLSWTKPTDISINGYAVYLNGTEIVTNISGTEYIYNGTLTAGTYNFTIKALNYGGASDVSETASIVIAVPSTPVPTATKVNEQCVVTWGDCKTSLPIAYYKVNTVNIGTALRYIERINWVGERTYAIVAVDVAGNQSVSGSTSITTTSITTGTGITTTGLTHAIRLTLTYETFTGFDCIEIWASATNDRTAAVNVGETAIPVWVHEGLDLVTKRYYWMRMRDIYGNTGSWYPSSSTAGIEGNTSTDPTDYLTILEGHLSSPLLDVLTTDIPAYSSIVTYKPGNTCYYTNGKYYQCILDSLDHIPTNATYWTEITDGILSEWTVKLNANGRVAGIGGMMNPSGSSEFMIVADKFSVVNITETNLTSGTLITGRYYQIKTYISNDDFTNLGAASNATGVIFKATGTTPTHWAHASVLNEILVPFIIGNVNGNSTVGINGDLIVDGSLLARHIATGTLTADKIASGFIFTKEINVNDLFKVSTAGVISIKSATSGARMEVTNSTIKVYDSDGTLRVHIGDLS